MFKHKKREDLTRTDINQVHFQEFEKAVSSKTIIVLRDHYGFTDDVFCLALRITKKEYLSYLNNEKDIPVHLKAVLYLLSMHPSLINDFLA